MCTMLKGIERVSLRTLFGGFLCLALLTPTVVAAGMTNDATSGVPAVAQQAAGADVSAVPSAAGCAKIGFALILVGVAFLAFRRSAGSRRATTHSAGVLALLIAAALLYLALPASGSVDPSGLLTREISGDTVQSTEQLLARVPRQPTPVPTRPPSTPTPCLSC
jgi:hypothetical protein